MPEGVRTTASNALIDTLADIHEVDVDSIGLGDIGRKDVYVAPTAQTVAHPVPRLQDREIPEIDDVHERLVARIPDPQGSGIVHGDYRLDNCIFSTDRRGARRARWELCTLGDVLAISRTAHTTGARRDEALLSNRPRQPSPAFSTATSSSPATPRGSDRDLSQLILHGVRELECRVHPRSVYSRYRHGAIGDRATGRISIRSNGASTTSRRGLRRSRGRCRALWRCSSCTADPPSRIGVDHLLRGSSDAGAAGAWLRKRPREPRV